MTINPYVSKIQIENLDEGNPVCAYPGPRTRASFRRSCVRSRGPIASHLQSAVEAPTCALTEHAQTSTADTVRTQQRKQENAFNIHRLRSR